LSQEEIYGIRDLSYSAWHRRESTRRFVGIEQAQLLAMIDLDSCLYIEYDDSTKEPICLMEVAQDIGQPIKPFTVTKKLAMRCKPILPAYVLLYTLGKEKNPANNKYFDISSFRFKCIWPEESWQWSILTPSQYANWLLGIRRKSSSFLDYSFKNNKYPIKNV
jgi:hypothetical protein